MRVIAHITPGPQWRPGRSVYGQGSPIEAHLEFMRARFDDSSLLLGGPLATGMAGIAVLDVPDLTAAESLAAADPAVEAGVLTYRLDELVAYFDRFSGVRAGGSAAALAGRRRGAGGTSDGDPGRAA